jgi:Ferritin-like domain
MHERYLRMVTTEFNRRTLFKGAAGAVGAATALSMGGGGLFNLGFQYAQTALAQAPLTDPDILNFALGLEHLENVMYRMINASGKLTGEASDLAKMFGTFEQAHVDALTKALQGANYANIAKEGTYKFPTFDTQDNILKFLNTVEPVGVGAYTGAANLIKDKSILGVAGSIVQVEARQLAITMALAGNKTPVSGALSESFSVADVTAKVKPLIA